MKYTTRIIGFLSLLTLFVVTDVANAQVCVAPPGGLVSWWPGDGDAKDSIGDNNPSAQSGVSFVTGKVGHGITLASDGFIDIPDNSNLQLQAFTIDAWVKPKALSTNPDGLGDVVFAKTRSFAFPQFSYGLSWSSADNRWHVLLGHTLADGSSHSSAGAYAPDQFYHVALTYDGTTLSLYVDGVHDSSATIGMPIKFSAEQAAIGTNPKIFRDLKFLRTWQGVIDELKLFNRALSASEIQNIFNAGSAGKCTEVPFAYFTIKEGKVKFHPSTGTKDWVEVEGEVDLGEESNGVDLSAEEVEVTVGTSSIAIPAGLFMPVGSRFEYEGTIYGAKVKMKIKETHSDVFEFKMKAKGLSVTDISNPVAITLRIGDDIGTAMVRLKGKLQFDEEEDD